MRVSRSISFFMLCLGSSLSCTAANGGSPASERAKPVAGGKAASMMMPFVVPLFIEDKDFTSSLGMVNDSIVTTYADLMLTDLNGTAITTYRVDFPPHSQRRIEIKDLLSTAGSRATMGKITIMQSPELKGMPIAAQLSITFSGSREPNFIDEEIAMPSAEGSAVLRAAADF
jgi:hypothetical protein